MFRALEIERAVYYLQETLPHDGVDVRALVVGDRVVAAIERVGTGWRANLARGARARPIALDERPRARCACAPRRRSAPTTPASTCCAPPTGATT